jgi:hypothetical protein
MAGPRVGRAYPPRVGSGLGPTSFWRLGARPGQPGYPTPVGCAMLPALSVAAFGESDGRAGSAFRPVASEQYQRASLLAGLVTCDVMPTKVGIHDFAS